MELNTKQIRAMLFLRDEPNHKAAWRTNGKAAYGPPSTWNEMKITGKNGSITIPISIWKSINPYIDTSWKADQIYSLNKVGQILLSERGL